MDAKDHSRNTVAEVQREGAENPSTDKLVYRASADPKAILDEIRREQAFASAKSAERSERPRQWWTCKKCGARDNPPLGERCLRCGAAREAGQALPKPQETPQTLVSTKQRILKIITVVGSIVTILSIASVFWPPLAPILAVIKAILNVLHSIASTLM